MHNRAPGSHQHRLLTFIFMSLDPQQSTVCDRDSCHYASDILQFSAFQYIAVNSSILISMSSSMCLSGSGYVIQILSVTLKYMDVVVGLGTQWLRLLVTNLLFLIMFCPQSLWKCVRGVLYTFICLNVYTNFHIFLSSFFFVSKMCWIIIQFMILVNFDGNFSRVHRVWSPTIPVGNEWWAPNRQWGRGGLERATYFFFFDFSYLWCFPVVFGTYVYKMLHAK